MIRIEQVNKKFRKLQALDNISANFGSGQVISLIGPNGSGKTTLIKSILGMVIPYIGKLFVKDQPVNGDPAYRSDIGYMPQIGRYPDNMKVGQLFEMMKKIRNADDSKTDNDLFEQFNIPSIFEKPMRTLSGGTRQKVSAALAFLFNPLILILDEPTVGLDPKQVAEIRQLIKELKGQHTIVLSTHILPEVQMTCERIIIINKGEIVAEDTLDGLNQRMSASKRIFVRVKNMSDALVTKIRGIHGVQEVRESGLQGGIEIKADRDDTVEEQIATTVATNGAGLVEMKSLDYSLEDIFLRMTSGGELQ